MERLLAQILEALNAINLGIATLAARPVSAGAVSLGVTDPQVISLSTTSAKTQLTRQTGGRNGQRLYTLTTTVNCHFKFGGPGPDNKAEVGVTNYLPAGLMIVVRIPDQITHLHAVVAAGTGSLYINEAVSQEEAERKI